MQLALKARLQRLAQQLKTAIAKRSDLFAESDDSASKKKKPPAQAGKADRARQAAPADEYVIEPVVVAMGQKLVRPFVLLAVLTLAVVLSALSVIFGAYEYRQLFHQQQKLIQQRDDLQVEWGQLLLEQSAWAANNRVEDQASKKLGMLVPDPQQIEIVRRGK